VDYRCIKPLVHTARPLCVVCVSSVLFFITLRRISVVMCWQMHISISIKYAVCCDLFFSSSSKLASIYIAFGRNNCCTSDIVKLKQPYPHAGVNLPPVHQIAPHEKKVNCWVEDGHNHESMHKIHVTKITTKWKYSL